MSDSSDLPLRSERWPKILRGLATLVVFFVVGPLIGWVIALAGLAARGTPATPPGQLPLSLAYGYVIGIVPAAAAGFIVAVRDILERPVNSSLAAAIGGAIGAVWGFYVGSEGKDLVFLGALVLIGSIVATMVCWWLTRRFIEGGLNGGTSNE